MRLLLASGVIAAVLLLCPAAGRADEPTNTVTHELAKKHYELGEKLYQISSYAQALEEFQKAYKLEPLPELLFNIARCHEVIGKLEEAIRNYKLYIEGKPDAKNRSVVEARIANLEKRIEAEKKQPATLPAAPSVAKEVRPAEQTTDERRPPSWRRTAGWTALGVGGAALVTGVIFGVLAKGKADDFKDGVIEGQTFHQLNEIDEAGKHFETVQIVTLVIGGVVAAAGGGLLLWDYLGAGRDSPAEQATLVPFATDRAFGLAGAITF